MEAEESANEFNCSKNTPISQSSDEDECKHDMYQIHQTVTCQTMLTMQLPVKVIKVK